MEVIHNQCAQASDKGEGHVYWDRNGNRDIMLGCRSFHSAREEPITPSAIVLNIWNLAVSAAKRIAKSMSAFSISSF